MSRSEYLHVQSYSCATEEILSMEDAIVYKYGATFLFGAVPLVLLVILFVVVDLSLLYLSYKETNTMVMSQKLKKIQRRFLLQLSLQSFIPLFLVSLPVLAAIIVFSVEIFGTACK